MLLQGDGVTALADHAHLSPFADRVAPRDTCRGELEQRHGIAVGRADGEDVATSWHGAGERDGPGGRCEYGAAELGRDVDAPVLASRVRIGADGEWTEHRPVGRPGPGEQPRRRHQGRQNDDGDHGEGAPQTQSL